MDQKRIYSWLSGVDLTKNTAVASKARMLLLDTLACAAAGFREPEVHSMSTLLNGLSSGTVRWPGQPVGLSAIDTAFVGTVAACWHETCEGLAKAHGRPGLHAVPAAVALGLAGDHTLGDVLTAIVRGYELGARAGMALPMKPGMHVDGTWGCLAAATTTASILSANLEAAVNIAASQFPVSLQRPLLTGSTARNTFAAQGVAHGIRSAFAALASITAPDDALEEASRVALDLAGPLNLDDSDDFFILDGYLKTYAGARHVHYGAICALDWRQRNLEVEQEKITGITLHTYPEALRYCGNRAPKTALQAQFSLSYAVAHAMARGGLGPEAYRTDALKDQNIQYLEELVCLVISSDIKSRGARLTVHCDGKKSLTKVNFIPGDPDKPLGMEDVADKARILAIPIVGEKATHKLIDFVLECDLSAPFKL